MRAFTKILVLLLGIALCGWFSINVAHAEEVELVPEDYCILTSSSPSDSLLQQEMERSVLLSPFTNSYCQLGTTSVVPDSVYLYNVNATSYLSIVNSGFANSFQDWSMTYKNAEIGLDMTDFPNGYYRYSADLYFGIGGGFSEYCNFSSVINLKSTYTFTSAPLYIGDSEDGMHCTVFIVGENTYQRPDNRANTGAAELFNLIHIYIESTFYFDSSYGTDVVFNIKPWFDSNISALSVDCSPLRAINQSRAFYFYANNRFSSSLVGNVDPPVTPTPSPTPYPGQDTQESINSGVQQIVQDLNVNATPVPAPDDLTIDETLFDVLDDLTLPDVTPAESTFEELWRIFDPLMPFIVLSGGSLLLVGVFMYCLRGHFI